jgi:hypothetical protein
VEDTGPPCLARIGDSLTTRAGEPGRSTTTIAAADGMKWTHPEPASPPLQARHSNGQTNVDMSSSSAWRMDHNADDLEVLQGHRAARIMKSSTNRMQKAEFVDIVDLPLAPIESAIMASIEEKGQIPT